MKKRKTAFYICLMVAFLVGIVANVIGRMILPGVLDSEMIRWTGFLSTVIQMVVSVIFIIVAVIVFKIGKED